MQTLGYTLHYTPERVDSLSDSSKERTANNIKILVYTTVAAFTGSPVAELTERLTALMFHSATFNTLTIAF